MYNCYNEAIQFLCKQLGTKEIVYNSSYYRNGKYDEPKTCKTYLIENIKPNTDEAIIHLLITQYNYGIAAKKELYYKLIELNVINDLELIK